MPYFKLFKDNKLQYWCHTKDYKVQQLLPGQNYMDFFNIPQTVPPHNHIPLCSCLCVAVANLLLKHNRLPQAAWHVQRVATAGLSVGSTAGFITRGLL
jgi:hypothetical protein